MIPLLAAPRDEERAAAALRVCHVMTADLWAGAEVQVATVASYLSGRPEVMLTAVLLNDGWLAQQLRQLGVPTEVLDEQRHTSLQIVRGLVHFLRHHDIQVVHTHRQKDTVLGAVAARLARVPHLIRTVHCLEEPLRGWKLAKYRVYDAIDRCALSWSADRVLAVSQRMEWTLKAAGYKSVAHLHNGIDLDRVRATRASADVRRDLGLDRDAIVIGTAGRLARVKGHEFLVRAARLIRRRERQAQFLFVGTGPLKGELLALAAELGVDNACHFVDPAVDSRSSVFDVMTAMDVFVLPSLNEGIPMALLEAMALKRPVVASAVGGVPEIVADRSTGLLVEPRNPDTLATACLDLVTNRHFAQSLGIRARQAVEQRFTHEQQGKALLTTYRDIVSGTVVPKPRRRSVFRAAGWLALDRLSTRLRSRRERRRMRAVRRQPESLLRALRCARTLVIVCHGNIIRSAFAEQLLIRAGGGPRLTIRSAGVEAVTGRPAHPHAVRTAERFGITLDDHRATRLTTDIVAGADVILVMDAQQLAAVNARFPEAKPKAFLFATLAANEPLDVNDPVLGDESVFQSCFERIQRTAQPIIGALRNPLS